VDAEDVKIVTLARTARTRAHPAPSVGAAARDETGRTYTAAEVRLSTGVISALAGVLSAAVSSGGRRFEAFAVVSDEPALRPEDRALLRELAAGVPVLLATPDGTVVATETI